MNSGLITPKNGIFTQSSDAQKARATEWFKDLRDQICHALEMIEEECSAQKHVFTYKDWKRQSHDGHDGGGGTMGLLKGHVFEKAGVNISTVYGQFAPEFAGQIPGGQAGFWASGISLVIHPRNPKVPAIHMNTRHISTDRSWFGGGTDLNPALDNEEDTRAFHEKLKATCDAHHPSYYPLYKKWCDEYFFIKHRHRPRGVGGIFYDYHDSGDFDADFAFTRAVGVAFLESYAQLVRAHMHDDFTADDRNTQLIKRGHYAEFNLVYDRGTKFGLMTGGHVEAILMSLPPEARWP